MSEPPLPLPLILPLGDQGLLVRFAGSLSAAANQRALAFAGRARAAALPGVVEVAANLVSVLLRYDPLVTGFERLAGEVRLLVDGEAIGAPGAEREIVMSYDGEDLDEVCAALGLSRPEFIAAHEADVLTILAIGFAPGFAYCGFHQPELHLPRRQLVRPRVPTGSILFAAGQTALTATPVPTGWHIIGHTALRNFDPASDPPVALRAGDIVRFRELP